MTQSIMTLTVTPLTGVGSQYRFADRTRGKIVANLIRASRLNVFLDNIIALEKEINRLISG
jgi:hypothetical protein